jgi:NAD(P)-dependent dehydrogenase (short-subunit alcohol dehydrogenase family)
VVVSRSESELKETGFPYIVADLGTEAGCHSVVSSVEKEHGRIDICVCNHGVGSAHEKVLWEQSTETWHQTMDINLNGPFYLTRAVMAGMKRRGYGRFVFTSSTAGVIAEPAGSAYNVSKHGLIGLMRSVAEDGGAHGITANAILPGWVKTDMADRSAAADAKEKGITIDEVWKQRAMLYPAGRVLRPEEVAEVIAFFSSEESGGVSGEAIKVALGGLV